MQPSVNVSRARDLADLARAARTTRISLPSLFAAAAVLTLAAPDANAVAFLPDFSAATFVPGAPVDSSYFPLIEGRTRVFAGQKEEDGEIVTERFELTDLGTGPTILGVQTTTQRDRAFEQGLLVEETFDYFAQDAAGNVWYLGEDVTNFIYDDDGKLIGTTSESAWRAGVNGALPGFIMPGDLNVGFNYFQEFAPNDDALDEGTIFSLGNFVSTPVGDFSNVLQILETTALDPDAREFKYYAPGLGLVLAAEGLSPDFEDPELTFKLVSIRQTAVPEPPTIALFGLGLAALAYQWWKKGTTKRV